MLRKIFDSNNIIKYPTNPKPKQYEQINLNYRPSDIRNICPKHTSDRASLGNKIRRFTDNMYIYIYKHKYIQNKFNLYPFIDYITFTVSGYYNWNSAI